MNMNILVLPEGNGGAFEDANFWIIVGVSLALAVLSLTISFTSNHRNNVLSCITAVIGVVSIVAFGMAPMLYHWWNPETDTREEAISNIQVWAESNYMITMSAKDAEILNNGKIDYDESTDGAQGASEAVVKYYDKKIIVTLIKEDKQWKLFSKDEELPIVEAKKK